MREHLMKATIPSRRSLSPIVRWMAGVILAGMACLIVGCVAQQADVVRIKRELDAKIHQLNKSKTSLQDAVGEANAALEKANGLIARQRAEIKELLHARAELMDQVATLKDTDLSQVRGAIEQNDHRVGELDQKVSGFQAELQTVRVQLQESQAAVDPLIRQLENRLGAEEKLLTEQGGKLGEFRSSLVDYQDVLASVRKSVSRQEQQVSALRQDIQDLHRDHEGQKQQVQAHFEEVRTSIQSVVGALEKVSTTFGGRLDEHEQRLVRLSSTQASVLPQKASVRPSASSSVEKIRVPSAFRATPPSYSPTRSVPENRVQARSSQDANTVASVVTPSLPRLTTPSSGGMKPPGGKPDPRRLYQGAFRLLQQRNYSAASQKFSQFLRAFPESSLAANAQYWLGECYYGQRRFQEAIDEFERVFAFYPTSPKVPASLLKIGYSHLERKEPAMARAVFQQLVRTYPKSSEAIKAHGRLQEVNAFLNNPS